ncbi:MAG: tRNA (adenosine(37)-N6)-threonylcarbamoyltransferase complex dimerization subunit type 1 TsaB, partial [Proteobacteria bacterium]|nr:tRNA (adenosine(37)-N6)-threonylcarbamoyltransferase complex dimerization subunit type 1 TsaB [Pseudomonadota bacterium]
MNLLAFDTSTEQLSIGVQRGARQWLHAGAGGAQASGTLIPTALRLLAEAGLELAALDAIAFGRGPGSFTGLRTACAVAQGLALGAAVPVLPVDTLLAVAEDARAAHGGTQVLALLDARMDQVYAQPWAWTAGGGWSALGEASVGAPEALALTAGPAAPWVLAGNAFAAYGARLP